VDRLVDVAVRKYAPLLARTLGFLVLRLRYAVPQLQSELKAALSRAKARLAHTRLDDGDWYWPSGDKTESFAADRSVRLLAPFDPIVWDRRRFELLWGWAYRFEAYTPVSKRKLGYYALPLLWGDRVIGWGNISVDGREMSVDIGYVSGRAPRSREFHHELDGELGRMRAFLGI
jgi:hypothetical protein